MSDLIFDHVRKVFDGGVVAVEDFTLTVPNPRMLVLVGPSGCGKTTLLRMIAGLEALTSGTIHLGEKRLDTMEPRDRDIAMVFQSYALYPHMTVAENLSFGLRVRKVARKTIDEKMKTVAHTLELDKLLARKPAELSGGQRQRVALGRAIIREPKVFLFDEPLSNLDARLRTEMRATIRRLYDRLRVTSVYVTHDQVEAMTIGDMLVIMNHGKIHQVGSPEECYRKPVDTFVAAFLGSPAMNMLDAIPEGVWLTLKSGGRIAADAETQRYINLLSVSFRDPEALKRAYEVAHDLKRSPEDRAEAVRLRALGPGRLSVLHAAQWPIGRQEEKSRPLELRSR
jgi:multiple sugar transport system ATP-binding protein